MFDLNVDLKTIWQIRTKFNLTALSDIKVNSHPFFVG